MATSPAPQTTDFTPDVLGRYVCNCLDEVLRSADKDAHRPLLVGSGHQAHGVIERAARPRSPGSRSA